MSRSRRAPCTARHARTRLDQAQQYLDVAELVLSDETGSEATVATGNAVLAGIAAADAICCSGAGSRYRGSDHRVAATTWRVSHGFVFDDGSRVCAGQLHTTRQADPVRQTEACPPVDRRRPRFRRRHLPHRRGTLSAAARTRARSDSGCGTRSGRTPLSLHSQTRFGLLTHYNSVCPEHPSSFTERLQGFSQRGIWDTMG